MEATEMWFLRRMLKIPWTKKISNMEVLKRADTSIHLIKTIRQRQLHFLGHVLRKEGIEQQVITGKVEGRRDCREQRMTFIQQLEKLIGNSPVTLLRLAGFRENFYNMTANNSV